MTFRFEGPDGGPLDDLAMIRESLLTPGNYWRQGSGGALIEFTAGSRRASMILLPHEDHGIYLKWLDDDETWLSLGDRSRLDSIVECSDEWFASVGLFVSPGEAWTAVEEFCRSGERTSRIAWIAPEEIPPEGNW